MLPESAGALRTPTPTGSSKCLEQVEQDAGCQWVTMTDNAIYNAIFSPDDFSPERAGDELKMVDYYRLNQGNAVNADPVNGQHVDTTPVRVPFVVGVVGWASVSDDECDCGFLGFFMSFFGCSSTPS